MWNCCGSVHQSSQKALTAFRTAANSEQAPQSITLFSLWSTSTVAAAGLDPLRLINQVTNWIHSQLVVEQLQLLNSECKGPFPCLDQPSSTSFTSSVGLRPVIKRFPLTRDCKLTFTLNFAKRELYVWHIPQKSTNLSKDFIRITSRPMRTFSQFDKAVMTGS